MIRNYYITYGIHKGWTIWACPLICSYTWQSTFAYRNKPVEMTSRSVKSGPEGREFISNSCMSRVTVVGNEESRLENDSQTAIAVSYTRISSMQWRHQFPSGIPETTDVIPHCRQSSKKPVLLRPVEFHPGRVYPGVCRILSGNYLVWSRVITNSRDIMYWTQSVAWHSACVRSFKHTRVIYKWHCIIRAQT